MDDRNHASIVKNAIYEMHQNGKFQLIEALVLVDSKLYRIPSNSIGYVQFTVS